MSLEEATQDWFAVGWAVYAEDVGDTSFFPPLNDMVAQRHWLGGFGAAWAASTDSRESVDEALARAATDHPELLGQLRCYRTGWGSSRVQ